MKSSINKATTWYEMRAKFFSEHNIVHNRLKEEQCSLAQQVKLKNTLEPNCTNQVIKNNKPYTNCGIIAVVMGIISSKIGNFLSSAQKHNQRIELKRVGLSVPTN